MRPIEDVARDVGFGPEDIQPWGPDVAKIRLRGRLPRRSAQGAARPGLGHQPDPRGRRQDHLHHRPDPGRAADRRPGHVRPARALARSRLRPEGRRHRRRPLALEPSARINLHFTGDLHAVTSAHNLLAALADNHVYFRTPAGSDGRELDPRQMTFRRVLDMNDRFLRRTVIGLGGKAMGVPREDGFDITAASEVMAILCLSRDYADLKERLGRILLGFDRERRARLRPRPQGRGRHGRAPPRRAAAEPRADRPRARPPSSTAAPSATSPTAATASSPRCSPCGAPTSCSPRRASASTWAPRSSSTSSAAPPASGPTPSSWSPRCAPSSSTAGCRRRSRGRPTPRPWPGAWRTSRSTSRACKQFGLEPVVAINVRAGDTGGELRYVLDRLQAARRRGRPGRRLRQGGRGGARRSPR